MTAVETIKSIAETAAIAAAGLFFLYKLIDGFILVDLSLELQVKRIRKDTRHDYLVAEVVLRKGGRASIEIRSISFRVAGGQPDEVKHVEAINRLDVRTSEPRAIWTIDWDKPDETQQFLRLSPDESTHFSEVWTVRNDRECVVDVVVVGKRLVSFRPAQWRASTVSLPVDRRDDGE